MQYLTKEIQRQYRSGQLHIAVQEAVLTLEILARTYNRKNPKVFPHGLRVTSLYRPGDDNSYHSKWQAIDFSIRDWDDLFKDAVEKELRALRMVDCRNQHAFEYDAPGGVHLHIEYDDGTLKKEK